MFFFIIKQSTFSSLKKYFNAHGYALTLHFTKGKFLMFLISQDIFMTLIQSMRKAQGK